MHKMILSLLLIVMTFSLLMTHAEAKRFGAGKSFGMGRSVHNFASPSMAPKTLPNAMRRGPNLSKWLGPIAGFALGGLLASLFMGHGLGTGIMSWAMMAGALFLFWQLAARFRRPAPFSPSPAALQVPAEAPTTAFSPTGTISAPQSVPFVGFDVPTFLRHAKTVFIRLQAAYDHNNVADIREFTVPEVFAEIQMQLHERPAGLSNQTEVVSIEAELVEHQQGPEGLVASVLFTALIRENANAMPLNVKETWHFIKTMPNAAWLVAGIQQQDGPLH